MGESIWCNVRVVCPKSWGDDPEKIPGVAMISDALINGERADIWSENPDRNIWGMSGEGNYGLYDDGVSSGLNWCREHKVPFYASSDPKYEMVGEIDVFDGERDYARTGDEQGDPVLHSSTFLGFLSEHDPLAAIREFFEGLPDIEKVDISHLPAVCPDTDDE